MANFKLGVGNNIKLLRKARNITQEELAETIGIHSRQLSKIETGEHFPSCKTLEKLCVALDVTPKVLFDFEFLLDENEGALTGTDNTVAFRVNSTASGQSNIYNLRPDNLNKESMPKTSTDESMAKTAKAINKPIFVEYFEENKASKIVVFYPDGREKVIKNSVDVEAKQNMIYFMTEIKKIAKEPHAVDFLKTSIESLKDDNALKELGIIVQGMKIARGVK